MGTALVAWLCVAAYTALTLLAARWRYAAIRPYTEPVSCRDWAGCDRGRHDQRCYRRFGMVDSSGEAVFFALLTGLAWPLILPGVLARRLVISGARELPEETEAKIKRLEAENERLRREQEGRRP